MKVLFILIILGSYCCVWAQDNEIKVQVENLTEDYEYPSSIRNQEAIEISVEQLENTSNDAENSVSPAQEQNLPGITKIKENVPVKEKKIKKPEIDDESNHIFDTEKTAEEKFHWKPAVIQSGIFLGIQHGFRLTQEKTRRELGGPFFRDWGQSVRSLQGWDDGNKFFTNYVAHPLQGGATGRIFINNSDRAKKEEFSKSKKYWETRLKAMAWTAVWSTQFEIGPISEATIGNVGTYGNSRYNKVAWVDFIVTPIAGTGVVVAEDALDKYVLKNWLERKSRSKTMIKIYRSLITPTISFANLLRGKMPWYRPDRAIRVNDPVFPID